jgi:DNA replication protein DnaC
MTTNVTNGELKKLEQFLGDDKDRTLQYLVHTRRLNPGDTLDKVSSDIAKQIISEGTKWNDRIWEFKTKEELQQELIDEKTEKESERLWQMTPKEFENLSAEGSPRPKQFKIVSEFFEPNGLYHSEEFRKRKHGLIFTGAPGLGKTADLYELAARGIESGEFTDTRIFFTKDKRGVYSVSSFEFVKSVTFFRLAKAKHLGDEQQEQFTKMFELMLRTKLLLLDDFGTEAVSTGSSETLFELIDTRCERWLFTAIATNNTISELAARFGPNEAKMLRRFKQFFLELNFDRL